MTALGIIPRDGEIILWDAPDSPPALDEGNVFTWNRHPGTNGISLLDYVEENGERLRERFLKWADHFGRTMIGGESLIERLSLGDGFSYWWMTPLAEKSPWKSPWIKDVLRLFAFEEILGKKRVGKIVLVSRNRRLRKILRNLCKDQQLEFHLILPNARSGEPLVQRGICGMLPHVLQGLATLARQVWIRRRFLNQKLETWKNEKNAVTIFSYFFNLETGTKEFRSRYWGNLTDLVRNLGIPVSWVHMFYPHPAVSKAGDALTKVDDFNAGAATHERHVFVDSFLSWSVVMRTIRNWLRLTWVSWRLGPALHKRHHGEPSFWPLISNDWNSSLRGSRAVMNLLWKELFDAFLLAVPRQSLGIYLLENQPWEQACVHSWHRNGHGKLVAVAHSTIRFWDLRYFGFKKDSSLPLPRPLPDVLAINGKGMREAIVGSEWPFKVCECEALRFGYLQPFCDLPKSPQIKGGVFRILVLGDYLPAETTRMLDLLASATSGISTDISFTLKPHPNHVPDLSRYGGPLINVATDPLADLLPSYDAAYASNITTAALDACLAGMPVIVLCPADDLNYSPLRGQDGVHFVTDRADFLTALDAVKSSPPEFDRKDYFQFDPEMRRWRTILKDQFNAANSAGESTSFGAQL